MISGMIIGVGFFALPYIAAQVGLSVMLACLFVLTAIVIIIHQYYAEVALQTPDFLRLPSYAGIYLGKSGKIITLVISIIGFSGTLLAYIVIGGEFLSGLLAPIFGGGQFIYAFIYFAFGALIIFFGVKTVSKFEFLDSVLFAVILLAVFWFGRNYFNFSNINFIDNLKNGAKDLFLPYGPILFALWGGANIISEVEEIIAPNKQILKKVVAWSIILPAIFYLIFILVVVGISGAKTSQEAIAGLQGILHPGIINLLLIFGLVATFTSFIACGLILRNIFRYDLKINKHYSWAIACAIPFVLYLAGFKDFIKIIGFIGATTLAVKGILIILMYRKIKKVNFLPIILIAFLFLGIIYEIYYFVR